MDKLLKEVLDEVTPSEKERADVLSYASLLADYAKGFGVEPIIVGSIAKDTDLRLSNDIDLFIQFDADTPRDKLESEGLRIGKKVFNKFGGVFEIDYAEHPYVKGVLGDYEVEIVPCYKGRDILSSVDRTPFHTRYVNDKIAANPALKGDIRLLKQFMKGREVYGAEAKVQGFSGYLAEVLTIHYSSFKKVLEAASQWKVGEAIDPESLWSDASQLKHFFTEANLIVVDPVDQDRNVAAAVSRVSLMTLLFSAKEFLENPSREFFFPKPAKPKPGKELLEDIRARETMFLAIKLSHGKLNENTLYSQLRRSEAALNKSFRKHEFKVFKSGFWTNEKDCSILVFEFSVWELPAVMHHVGPPLDLDAGHQERFKLKHAREKPYVKDGRWVADVKRKVTSIEDLVPGVLKNRDGFGKNLRKIKAETIYGEDVLNVVDEGYQVFLGGFM